MTMRLIHVDQLETLYLCYGVICQSEVIWGHWGQKLMPTGYADCVGNISSFFFLLLLLLSSSSFFWQHLFHTLPHIRF